MLSDDVAADPVKSPGDEKWPRAVACARCFRGIIVIDRGAALLRTSILETDAVAELDPTPRKPAGAVGRLLTCADGSLLEVAIAPVDVVRFDRLRISWLPIDDAAAALDDPHESMKRVR